ncbi:MAG TPA: ribosome maturation factor RimM [Flavobacteriaceae bacterium]|nr:ribosome maturation factor RimM [Flavobacteriaceae bacterium]
MEIRDCFYLGKITKKYSFKGELIINLDTDEPEIYEDLKSIFININGKLIPFFIEKSTFQKKSTLRIKFEDVNSEEEASSMINKEAYLPLEDLPKLKGKKFYYHEIIGYNVVDSNYGDIGLIIKVDDKSLQSIFVVENKGKQILIPINDNIIETINRKNKTIYISAPNGLIDLYLK